MVNDSLTVVSKAHPVPLSCLMKNKIYMTKILEKRGGGGATEGVKPPASRTL